MAHDNYHSRKTWELTAYEIFRKPQLIRAHDTPVGIKPRSLHSELMCPICLDLLQNTHTTKECLHRFCCECITTALRSGNKECPTCRKKLVSRRSLRPDPNFDKLISQIYPNRDSMQSVHQVAYEAMMSHANSTKAHFQSVEEGLQHQSIMRNQRPKKNDFKSELGDDMQHTNIKEEIEHEPHHMNTANVEEEQKDDSDGQVTVELKAHPEQNGYTATRRFKVEQIATVGHISKYLTEKITHDPALRKYVSSDVYNLFVKVKRENTYTKAEPNVSLREVRHSMQLKSPHLTLYYLCESSEETPDNQNL